MCTKGTLNSDWNPVGQQTWMNHVMHQACTDEMRLTSSDATNSVWNSAAPYRSAVPTWHDPLHPWTKVALHQVGLRESRSLRQAAHVRIHHPVLRSLRGSAATYVSCLTRKPRVHSELAALAPPGARFLVLKNGGGVDGPLSLQLNPEGNSRPRAREK